MSNHLSLTWRCSCGAENTYSRTDCVVCSNKFMGERAEELRLKKIQTDRQALYGDSAINMRTLGIAFTALVEQHYQIKLPGPIPPHVAALIMAAVKTVRMAGPAYHADNYDDARNYLRFADETDERKPK